jgi:hypothetical protein
MNSRFPFIFAVSATLTACSPIGPSSSGEIEHILVSAVGDTLCEASTALINSMLSRSTT